MISIREYAGIFHPGRREKRNLVLFRFYCDESYDGKSNDPDFFTMSGFFSDQPTWEEVEGEWFAVNQHYGVQRGFHATELNGRGPKTRYAGWDKARADEYSARLLHCVNRQKMRMRAYNCGIRGDAYRKVISGAGQIKMGHPWICCFQSCIAMIAKDMETLPREDTFSVVLGRENRFDALAVAAFGSMAENPSFPYRHRLDTCTPGNPEKVIPLQVADLMAFEYFKRMWGTDKGRAKRPPLELIQQHNAYCEGFFSEETFTRMKSDIESSICGPNQLVVIPSLI
jgi:hypothetical protein